MKGSDTRERILEVAARLFREQSFDGTAVSAILQDAEVNSGSLYHFFPGKEALLAGVVDRYVARLGPEIIRPVEDSMSDPVERVFSLLAHYRLALLVSDCSRGCPVGDLALEMGDRIPHVRLSIEQYFQQWTAAVGRWLDEAGPRLPADLDRQALARLVLATMEGAVMQSRAARDLGPFDASVSQLRVHFDLLELSSAAPVSSPDVSKGPAQEAAAAHGVESSPPPEPTRGPLESEPDSPQPELEWRAW